MSSIYSKTSLNFSQLWDIQTEWFEAPNHRRGGWSGVIKYTLPTDDGETDVFIKRQENHFSRTWRHPVTGLPTFQKEFFNIKRLIKHQIPTLDVVFFGVENKRAIIVTKALNDFESLDRVPLDRLSRTDRHLLLKRVAKVLANLHKLRLQHSSFYPKHIFVRKTQDDWEVKLIDLENLKWRWLLKKAVVRDLSTLDRHAGNTWSIRDRLTFLQAYFDEKSLSKRSKKLWLKLQNKDRYKRR